MTREIKFRAWWITGKKWIYLNLREVLVTRDMFDWHDYENWTQFTGLKDKNGKEIYEGDIVECKDQIANHIIRKLEVVFREGGFCFNDRYMNPDTLIWKYNTLEVIGNIYENPELLKEVEK